MATIATPKVSYNSTPLPTKSSWIDPTKEPVNVLAIPGAGNSDSQEETVGYCEDTARVIQRARAGTNKAQGETVNQFLARDKKELLEEGSDVKSSIKESNDQDLDNIFCMQESKTGRSSGKHVKRGIVRAPTIGKDIGEDLDDLPSYGSTAGSSQDELIILESNSKSEDRDDNLDNTLAFNTRDSEQLSHDALEIINTNQNWEVNKIIGKKYVNGVLHYLVKWCPTLEPVHLLEHAKELVDEFEARRLVERKDKKGHMRSGIKRGNQAVIEADVSGS